MTEQTDIQDVLKEHFLSLLETRPLKEIKVKDLCDSSGIHRSTFYLHYHRIDDLVQDLFDDVFDQMDPSCCKYLTYKNIVPNGGMPPCEFIRNNRKYLPLFQDEVLSLYFTNLAMTRYLPVALLWLEDSYKSGDEQFAYGLLSFLIHGCIFGTVSTIDLPDEAWDGIRNIIDDGISLAIQQIQKNDPNNA